MCTFLVGLATFYIIKAFYYAAMCPVKGTNPIKAKKKMKKKQKQQQQNEQEKVKEN